MEQAIALEDVLKCHLVLMCSHSSKHTGTELGCFQLAGSSHHNYQHHLKLIAENGLMWPKCSCFTLCKPSGIRILLHIQKGKRKRWGESCRGSECWCCPGALSQCWGCSTFSCSIPDSLCCGQAVVSSDNLSSTRLSEDDILELNSLLFYKHIAMSSAWKKNIGAASICTSAFWNKILAFFFQIQIPSMSPQVFISRQNHNVHSDSCIKDW